MITKSTLINTFWEESSTLLSDAERGRTESEIIDYELQIGFKLPTSFRELYKIQNGGRLRKKSYCTKGKVIEWFDAPVEFESMGILSQDDLNMKNWIISVWGEDEEDIETLSDAEYNNLERLIFISLMHGHSWLLFDYGWKTKDILEEPEVLMLDDDFREILRTKNFDEFLNGLLYFGYDEEYFFGVNNNLSLNEIVKAFSDKLKIQFSEESKIYEYRYNFSKWYLGGVKINSEVEMTISISPNKFLTGRFLFSHKSHINHIIGIDLYDHRKNEQIIYESNKYLKLILEKLSVLPFQDDIEVILIPKNVEER